MLYGETKRYQLALLKVHVLETNERKKSRSVTLHAEEQNEILLLLT